MSDPGINPPERYFSLLGFIIVRKADFLAAAAFVLALSSALYQLDVWASGPRVRLFAPRDAIIAFELYEDGNSYAHVLGQTTFTNVGPAGHGATLRDVTVDMRTGNGPITKQHWLSIPKVERNSDGGLSIEPLVYAAALEVPGGTTVSKMLSFAPEPRECPSQSCNTRADFLTGSKLTDTLIQHRGDQLTLEFHAETYEGAPVIGSVCRIEISDYLIRYLIADDWIVARCRQAPENNHWWSFFGL